MATKFKLVSHKGQPGMKQEGADGFTITHVFFDNVDQMEAVAEDLIELGRAIRTVQKLTGNYNVIKQIVGEG